MATTARTEDVDEIAFDLVPFTADQTDTSSETAQMRCRLQITPGASGVEAGAAGRGC